MKNINEILNEQKLDPVIRDWLSKQIDSCLSKYDRGFLTHEEFDRRISAILTLACNPV